MDLEKIARFLKYVSERIGLSELNGFIVIKLVYLFQEIGLLEGIKFGWFIYNPLRFEGPFTIGPYSTQLAYYLEDIFDKLKEVGDDLNDDERYLLELVISMIDYLFQRFKGSRRSIEYILEILTSLHYAYKYSGLPKNMDEVISRLVEVKPELKKYDLIVAWDLLKKIGLIGE